MEVSSRIGGISEGFSKSDLHSEYGVSLCMYISRENNDSFWRSRSVRHLLKGTFSLSFQVNGRDVANKEQTENLFAETKTAVTILVSRCVYQVRFNLITAVFMYMNEIIYNK